MLKMKKQISYDTVSEAINDLIKRGYTTDFTIHTENECLICKNTATQLSPSEFEIDETYRFEGDTDPGDEMIVFAISSTKQNVKGIVVNAYGMYADSATSAIVEKLVNHINTKKPIKRADYLSALSREHHHGLLLCWKIKTGLAKKISPERIKVYTDWFYKNYLSQHFAIEERVIFPILGNENVLIKQALEEHKNLTYLFETPHKIEASLQQIQIDLDKHIRFEERILFNEVQTVASEEDIAFIRNNHSDERFIDNVKDAFWQ